MFRYSHFAFHRRNRWLEETLSFLGIFLTLWVPLYGSGLLSVFECLV